MPMQDIKRIYTGLQDNLGNKDACHFLTLCSIAHEYLGRKIDILSATIECIEKGLIAKDFYVKDNIGVLELLTGEKGWVEERTSQVPIFVEDNEFTELVWYCSETKQRHYTRKYIDTLFNSYTVKHGKVIECRIYRKEDK